MQTFTSSLLLAAAGSTLAWEVGNTDYSHDGNYGAPFPDTTYPGFESANPVAIAGSQSFQSSPPKYPSPCKMTQERHLNKFKAEGTQLF